MFVHATGAGAAVSTTTAGDVFETTPTSTPPTFFNSAAFPTPAATGAAFARSGCRSTLVWERSARKGNFAGAAVLAKSESTPGDPLFIVAEADTADLADGG